MTNSVSVPHHRVDASTHASARDLASSNGVSLSQVAETGLRRYIEQHPMIYVGAQIASAPVLPGQVIDALVNMRHIGDAQLDNALAALHRAGWSYAALAKPIGLTRQAVHLRVSKAAPAGLSTLPYLKAHRVVRAERRREAPVLTGLYG